MSQQTFTHILDTLSAQKDHVTVGDSWTQGRATYGGLVAALGVRRAAMMLDGERSLRSMLVTFSGPAGGDIDLAARALRVGKSAALYHVALTSMGETSSVINLAFGGDRPSKSVMGDIAEHIPDKNGLAPAPTEGSLLPGFLRNMETRWVGDGIPCSGQKARRMRMWVRLKDAVPARYRRERLVALADMPPPVMLSHYTNWVNASSMTWALDFTVPPEDVTDDWLFLDFTLEAANNGYTQQRGKLYGEDGRLLALSQQTMTFFEPKA